VIAQIERSRQVERLRFGDTVFLLEPDVKRSGGTLRDIQLFDGLVYTLRRRQL